MITKGFQNSHRNKSNKTYIAPYFLLQCSLEKLQEQEVVTVISSIVVQGENHIFYELCGLARRNCENEGSQVVRLSLEKVEEVLVG